MEGSSFVTYTHLRLFNCGNNKRIFQSVVKTVAIIHHFGYFSKEALSAVFNCFLFPLRKDSQ